MGDSGGFENETSEWVVDTEWALSGVEGGWVKKKYRMTQSVRQKQQQQIASKNARKIARVGLVCDLIQQNITFLQMTINIFQHFKWAIKFSTCKWYSYHPLVAKNRDCCTFIATIIQRHDLQPQFRCICSFLHPLFNANYKNININKLFYHHTITSY